MKINIIIVNKIIDQYGLNKKDRKEIFNIIYPIYNHEEFKRRMNPNEFPHHGKTSLGEHIIKDAIETFILSKKKRGARVRLAVLIAMFHDLYEYPWQNAIKRPKRLIDKHGFVHPIEAAINAITWYPQYFYDEKVASILIDGIIHHMSPFPVRSLDGTEPELNNQEKFDALRSDLKDLIIQSTLRKKIGHISVCSSQYLEGKLVSKADKKVSLKKDLKSMNSLKALVTGNNPDLNNFKTNKKKSK